MGGGKGSGGSSGTGVSPVETSPRPSLLHSSLFQAEGAAAPIYQVIGRAVHAEACYEKFLIPPLPRRGRGLG
ncbi:MAG: hypothetical protein FJ126_12450 [Deltaproteobacteria bacterium]|nr:hypothetical protein [Deltaproteobacteria bacterium]